MFHSLSHPVIKSHALWDKESYLSEVADLERSDDIIVMSLFPTSWGGGVGGGRGTIISGYLSVNSVFQEGGLEEEQEGQPSLEQTATSVAAGEEEEGELKGGTVPTDQPSTSPNTWQIKQEGGERELWCNRASWKGSIPQLLSPTSYSACEEKATTNCLGWTVL